MRSSFVLAALSLVLYSCSPNASQGHAGSSGVLTQGEWLLTLQLNDTIPLPVRMEVTTDSTVVFINGEERLTAHITQLSVDSLHISMPYFKTAFRAKVLGEGSQMTGAWYDHSKQGYSIPFQAKRTTEPRFCEGSDTFELAKRYEVHFSDGGEYHYPAVGLFEQGPEGRVLGTFATETGDYRYLEGAICDGRLLLSCFDGSHAFVFSAKVKEDSLSDGQFYSGKHWNEPWHGWVSPQFDLRDPYTLTEVVDSSALGRTRYVLEDGSTRSLDELLAPGEVGIVQIMGSWCPNCMDESLFFKSLYQEYSSSGLKILPLAFESSEDLTVAYSAIEKLEKDLELPYHIYYGGSRKKSSASAALPALNHIMSYPTSIYIDKKGRVRTIHTGFYGPSTGAYYERYKEMTHSLIRQMLSES